MDILRALLLLVLGVGVAGFGLCAVWGGAMGIATMLENTPDSGNWAGVIFGFTAVAVLLTGLCWWGFRTVRKRKPTPDAIDAP